MNTSSLENPIWNSLRTDHARLAEGDDCARRYPHEIGPLAGIPDQSNASYNSLRTLAGDHPIALFSLETIKPRGNWTTIRTGRVIQMVRTINASTTDPVPTPDHKPVTMPPDTSTTTTTPTTTTTSPTSPAPTAPTTTPSSFIGTVTASTNPVPTPEHKPVIMPPDTSTTNPLPPAPSTTSPTTSPRTTAPSSFTGGSISSHHGRHPHQTSAVLETPALDLAPGCTFRRLTASDAPAMVALAELTEPGPFRLRTIELGNFYGIFDGDRLVSMAGKRMHFPGFIEVSGVCTHPDYRGRGYAGALIRVITDEIEATGRTPFLHAWEGNPAQYLYESLGFTLTRTFNLSALAAA